MKHIIILLLMITSLFAVSIDKSWYENTNEELEKVYTTQNDKLSELKKTELSPEVKEQLDYQSILLKKLSKSLKDTNIFVAKDINEINGIDDYVDRIKQYSDIAAYSKTKSIEVSEIERKLQDLEDQINKFTEKDDITTINSQLLYALYNIQNKQLKANIIASNEYVKNYKLKLIESLKNKVFVLDTSLADKITKTQNSLNSLLKDERRASLALDKATISENENRIANSQKELKQIQDNKIILIDNYIYLKVKELLIPLQNKKSSYFDLNKALEQFINSNQVEYNSLLEILKYLSREYIGITKSTFADTKESFIDIVKFGWDEVNKPYIPLGEGVSILDVTKFLFIFIVGFFLASLYRKKVSNANLKNSSPATKTMLANLGFYFLVFLTFVFALNSVGIDLSSLTILVGALSVGIGFGLQNIVSNFISGIILIFEKSIQVGNIIEIENEVRGRVSQVNMRSSVITTFDNVDIIIPNSTLMQNNVINLTFADDIRRLHVPFGVAYGTEAKYVIKTILAELEQSNLIYIKDDLTKVPNVWMTGMGASSVDFKLLVWINSNTNRVGLDSSNLSDFLIFIYETLNKYNIEIPFPQMDIHMKTENETL